MLYVQEAANLFVGDDTPNASKHHNLMSIALPTLEEKSSDHYAGGAIGEIAIGGLGLNKIESSFKLMGYDPQVQSKFGVANTPFTCYGLIRDKMSNRPIEVKSILWGRIGRIGTDEFSRGNPMQHDLMIHEILRYICYFDGVEKYWYDWKTSDWRIDGSQRNADERRILRIPGV